MIIVIIYSLNFTFILAKCVRELEELEFLNDIIPEQVSQ